ncbi:trypsin-like serine peptidase [Pseudomonas fluorescens]|uniref:trypsin-like serine peptidase n=1 Tax=Pseudomonas fluorescens TaxID=294 RepID=UPI0012404164|nr:trypsin-like serine protease [Pseudomonas fluorescens]
MSSIHRIHQHECWLAAKEDIMRPHRQVFLYAGMFLAICTANNLYARDYLCHNDAAELADRPAGLTSETPLVQIAKVPSASGTQQYQVVQQFNGTVYKSMGNQPSLVALPRGPKQTSFTRHHSFTSEGGTVQLPSGVIGYWKDLSSDESFNLPKNKIPSDELEAQTQGELLALFKRNDFTSHTISTEDTKSQLKTSMSTPAVGNAAELINRYKSNELSSCNQRVTDEYREQRIALSSMEIGNVQAIARMYLSDREAFLNRYTEKEVRQVTEKYVSALKSLLDNCYTPAEQSAFVKQHSLMNRLGKIMWSDDNLCTGLSVGSGTYVLTARHCFKNLPNDSDVWFQAAMSQDRFQVCAISQKDALTEDKVKDVGQDQVLVRIAPGLKSPSAINVLQKSALRTMTDQKNGDSAAPTLLTQISHMPLANSLDPEKYPSGFVEGKGTKCAAKAKSEGCFSHVCSMEGGGSGSALFVSGTPVLTLAATHIGESNTSSLCDESYSLNIATYINKAFLSPFKNSVNFIETP